MIPCDVTTLVLYFHLFFYISRGLDKNRSIVAQVTPLQCPIHLSHDNTYYSLHRHLSYFIPPLRSPFLTR